MGGVVSAAGPVFKLSGFSDDAPAERVDFLGGDRGESRIAHYFRVDAECRFFPGGQKKIGSLACNGGGEQVGDVCHFRFSFLAVKQFRQDCSDGL